MAYRNLTNKFENYRKQKNRKSITSPSITNINEFTTDSGDALLKKGENEADKVAISVGLEHSLPPEWVEIVDTIQQDINSIKTNLTTLEKLHDMRLKVTFDKDESDQEKEIDILTREVTRLLKKCEVGLKRIATIGNARGTNLPQQERTVRLNVMRNLGSELHDLSLKFRKAQKDFMVRLKGQEEVGGEYFKDDKESKEALSLEEAVERGLTPGQMAQLQETERNASEREKEIIHIAQSINDLASLFRELSVLVIEQGTILDRIDYNIEQTLHKVKQGTDELKKANEYSKKSRTIKCIIFLTLLVGILVFVVILKKTNLIKNNN